MFFLIGKHFYLDVVELHLKSFFFILFFLLITLLFEWNNNHFASETRVVLIRPSPRLFDDYKKKKKFDSNIKVKIMYTFILIYAQSLCFFLKKVKYLLLVCVSLLMHWMNSLQMFFNQTLIGSFLAEILSSDDSTFKGPGIRAHQTLTPPYFILFFIFCVYCCMFFSMLWYLILCRWS